MKANERAAKESLLKHKKFVFMATWMIHYIEQECDHNLNFSDEKTAHYMKSVMGADGANGIGQWVLRTFEREMVGPGMAAARFQQWFGRVRNVLAELALTE